MLQEITTFKSLGLNELTTPQKVVILENLWEDLTGEVPPGIWTEGEYKAELIRRRDDAIANPDDRIPWEQVLGDTLKRLEK